MLKPDPGRPEPSDEQEPSREEGCGAKKARLGSLQRKETSGGSTVPHERGVSEGSSQREVSEQSVFSQMSEYTYSYDSDDGDYHRAFSNGSLPKSTRNLDEQVEEVNARFGEDVAIFCPADAVTSNVCQLLGHAYLLFPLDDEMRNRGKMWGFDPQHPIQLRMNVHSTDFGENQILSKRELGIEVYQIDEPSVVAGGRFSASRKSPDGKEKEGRSFRLGHQLKKIAEDFIVANWQGAGRSEGVLTLPKNCKACTYLNSLSANQCTMCGSQLQHNNVREEKSNDEEFADEKFCKACTYLNSQSAIQCSMCGSQLQKIIIPEVKPETPRSARSEMLRVFLDNACGSGRGLLVRLYAYLNARIPELHRFCVICDNPHITGVMGGIAPIRPSVCRRELCSWTFTELGIGCESTDELASAAEVVDLLLAITTAAATSHRADVILSPFPLVIHRKKKILDPDEPDHDAARAMVNNLPSMQQLVAGEDEAHLIEICKQKGDHIFDLLTWIISSCPAHLVSLQGPHRLESMGTAFQFLNRSASPEQEQSFSAAKKKHGSVYAFHGSPIENWHAIIRNGLKNASGTKLQMHGAAYGPGVYVSPQASLSLGYSRVPSVVANHGSHEHSRSDAARPQGLGNNFISGQQVQILGLCEIIADDSIKKNGSVWVVPNEEHVITRFLFVFVPSSPDFQTHRSAAATCDTTNDAFQRELESFMQKVAAGDYS